uniref:Uncharacterized protein n=1 Tax=Oryza punctata TaxID=4537 RepID=A0A0E0LZ93_ORYPU
MPEVAVVRSIGAWARRKGRPGNSGEADGEAGATDSRQNREQARGGDDAVMLGKETVTSAGAPARNSGRLEGWSYCMLARTLLRQDSGEEAVRPGKRTVLQSQRSARALRQRRPAPRREKEEAGRDGVATGKFGKGQNRERGGKGPEEEARVFTGERLVEREKRDDRSPESPPPIVSVSNQPIVYAAALSPSEEHLLPSLIGLNAPEINSLLQGEIREPIAKSPKRKGAGKRKQSKKITKKPAAKKKRISKGENLEDIDPALDPFLEDEVLDEEIDEAAIGLSEEDERSEQDLADDPTNAAKDLRDDPADVPPLSPSPPYRLRKIVTKK